MSTPGDPVDRDEAVRRLLAGTRHDDAVPADVADRLDETLARLAADRQPDGSGVVVPLASARQRRWRGLVAAAAAVALVGGAGYLVVRGTPPSPTASAGSSTSDTAADGDTAASRVPETSSLSRLTRRSAPAVLHRATFGRDVRLLLDGSGPGAAATRPEAATPGGAAADRSPAEVSGSTVGGCTPPPDRVAGSAVLQVRLDGRAAVLVVQPPEHRPRRAAAYSCDGTRLLAVTTLHR